MNDKTWIKSFLILIILILLGISAWSMDYLTLENFHLHKEALGNFIEKHYYFSLFLFIAACSVFINTPFPLAALLKILGGVFFGVYLGTFFNALATLIACLIGFWISRYIFRDMFEKRYYQKLKEVENDIEKNGFYYILTLRVVMSVPYVLINAVAGISRISFTKYFFGTAIGVIPPSFIYANAGSHLEQINSVSELFDLKTIIILSFVGLIPLFPVLNKKLNPARRS